MPVIMPEENKTEFELTPAGSFAATCYRVIDLGTQLIEYMGERKTQHKIMLSWELSGEKMQDGRPFSMHKRYTLSSSEKATLRKHLEAWRGVAFTKEDLGRFSISNLLGKSCLLGIMHTTKGDKTYADLSSIMRLPKGMPVETLVNELIDFSLTDFNQATYEKLSESLRAVIAKSPEYQSLKKAHHVDAVADDNAPVLDDEIPFAYLIACAASGAMVMMQYFTGIATVVYG